MGNHYKDLSDKQKVRFELLLYLINELEAKRHKIKKMNDRGLWVYGSEDGERPVDEIHLNEIDKLIKLLESKKPKY